MEYSANNSQRFAPNCVLIGGVILYACAFAIAYSIVVLAVSGVTFGTIWARTKNLFALMLIHAGGDLLPNFGAFVRTWF